jgi:hypothetical protein
MAKERSKMKGHEIAENLRNSKYRFTAGQLHRVIDGEDAFCTLGLMAYEAGVSIQRLDAAWKCSHIPNASKVYQINDDVAISKIGKHILSATTEEETKARQAVIDAFDSPKYHDFDFPVEAFIQYLKDTIE